LIALSPDRVAARIHQPRTRHPLRAPAVGEKHPIPERGEDCNRSRLDPARPQQAGASHTTASQAKIDEFSNQLVAAKQWLRAHLRLGPAACSRIRREVRLVAADGREPPELLLHIDGEQARQRWHGESAEDASSGRT